MHLKTLSNQNINFISHRHFYLSDSRINATMPVSVRKRIFTCKKGQLWSMGADVLRVHKFSALICYSPELNKRNN